MSVCALVVEGNTHAGIGYEGDDVDDLTGAGVDKGFVPFTRLLVLDLDDVGEDNVVRVLGEVLNIRYCQ